MCVVPLVSTGQDLSFDMHISMDSQDINKIIAQNYVLKVVIWVIVKKCHFLTYCRGRQNPPHIFQYTYGH